MKAKVALALLAVAVPLRAQSIPLADSLLRAGSLARAESVYYAAARARPHDPIARWALGRFLVARGAPRVGATLLEESLKFGGEPAIVGRDLAPVYLAIGDYHSLAALAGVSPAERARARWLMIHEPRVIAPDSVLTNVYWPGTDSDALGHIPIRVNGKTVEATVSARVQGIVIGDMSVAARGLHRFEGGERDARSPVLATADSIGVGKLSLVNVPVTIERLDDKQAAVVGLDMLSRFAPTFDPKAGRVFLRTSGAIGVAPVGDRFPTLFSSSDFRILKAGAWLSVTEPQVNHSLRDHRWTVDAKRGQLITEP